MTRSRFVYVGTDSDDTRGLFVFASDGEGTLHEVQRCAASHPTYLAVSADERRLYAIENDTENGAPSGAHVSAWAIDDTSGRLASINRVAGTAPRAAHIGIAPNGRHLVVSNYGHGTLDVFSLSPNGAVSGLGQTIRRTGSGPHPRQSRPHPHMAIADPAGRVVVAIDLGLDTIEAFVPGNDGLASMQIVGGEAGAGLRHGVFHPHLGRLYVCAELSSQVFVFDYSADSGRIGRQLQAIGTTGGLPAGESDVSGITTDAGGTLIAVGNRKMSGTHERADSIAMFAVDAETGLLSPPDFITDGVDFPRALAFDPNGEALFVANQHGNTVTSYRLSEPAGQFRLAGTVPVPCPMVVAFKT